MPPFSLFLLFWHALADGGQKVRLYGAVFDKATKSPLPGANVFVLELKRGGVTDADGAFNIDGLESGRYTLVCRLLGYEEMRKTTIIAAMNLKQDFYLKPNPIELQGVEVSVEKEKATLTESSQALEVLSDAELQKHRGQTLGETLKEVPGVTVLRTGPAIAKPVIRGLRSHFDAAPKDGVNRSDESDVDIDFPVNITN